VTSLETTVTTIVMAGKSFARSYSTIVSLSRVVVAPVSSYYSLLLYMYIIIN
jgi:hypothetical protein